MSEWLWFLGIMLALEWLGRGAKRWSHGRIRPEVIASFRWGIIGAWLGFFAGALLAILADPSSNLAGLLVGLFITAPLGLVLGAVIGYRLAVRDST
jgi:Na+/phosphate symporter